MNLIALLLSVIVLLLSPLLSLLIIYNPFRFSFSQFLNSNFEKENLKGLYIINKDNFLHWLK